MSYWPFDEASPFDDLFKRYGAESGVDPILLRLMANKESSFRSDAISPKGASGLFQIMPDTARDLGVDPATLHDPEVSTRAGAQYMSQLLKRYQGDTKLALAAYNAGMGRVDQYGGVPPFPETQDYVTIADEYEKLVAQAKQGSERAQQVLRGLSSGPAVRNDDALQGDALARRVRAGLSGESEYKNPYPRGSKEWSKHILAAGGLPAIRPTAHAKGSPVPTVTQPFPESGPFRPFDETYPIQYKGRVHRVIDADTIEITEQGTGHLRTIRLPDLQAEETDEDRIRAKHPTWSDEQVQEALLLGTQGRDYVAGLLTPGDQLTIETGGKAGETGTYGRDIGKVYWTDARGNTIDLSTAWKPTTERVTKRSDPLSGESGNTGFLGAAKGIGSSLLQDAAEMAQLPWTLGDLADHFLGDDSYDPYVESSAYRALERFRRDMAEKQAEWVSAGYDPDDKVYDIPGLGRLTMEEVAKAGITSSAYALGVIPLISKLGKLGKSLALAGSMGTSLGAARIVQKETKALTALEKRVRKNLGKNIKDTDQLIKQLEFANKRIKSIHEKANQIVHTVGELQPNATAVDKIKLAKDMFLSGWRNKYSPLQTLAKSTGDLDELNFLLNQVNAAATVSKAPIFDGIMRWTKTKNGYKPLPVHESLHEIWQGVRATEAHFAMVWSASDRVLDIDHIQRPFLRNAGGDAKKAKELAEAQGVRWIEQSDETVQFHRELRSDIEKFYKSLPLHDTDGKTIGNHWEGVIHRDPDTGELLAEGGLKSLVDRTRDWSVKATLDVAEDVGWIDSKQKIRILQLNQHHSPFNRTSLGYLDEVLPADTVEDILRLENEMLKSQEYASLIGKGLSEQSMKGKPVPKLRKGLDPTKPEDVILDPFQTYMVRVPALTKAANQQRVRNMLGDILDDLGAGKAQHKAESAMEKWVQKTVQVVTDETPKGRKIIDAIKGSPVSSGFVKYVNGKQIGYITHDPALSHALANLDPAHMNLFKQMAMSPWGKAIQGPTQLFRAGTVMGLHFMARNPMRDQFMAAVLTKYGYTPVVDWWRGMFHVATKSPLYKQANMGGGAQSTFTAATMAELDRGIEDVLRPENLGEMIRRGALTKDNTAKADTLIAHQADSPYFKRNHGLDGILNGMRESYRGFRRAAGADEPGLTNGAKLAFHGLRRISEHMEEATRIGAYAKAVRRAKKGKRYTFIRSVDEAIGGASGFFKMLNPSYAKGFGKRFKQAYRYSPDEMQRMRDTGIWLDPDMVDEIRNITLDFQIRGNAGEFLNSLYPFFNAEIQDYARFSRAMAEAPLTTMLKGFTFVSIPAIANWYLNFDDPRYHQEPDVGKELFLHPFGFSEEYGRFQRVSRPLGMVSGFFGILPHKLLDFQAANDPAAIRALEEEFWPGRAARRAKNLWLEGLESSTKDLDQVPLWARHVLHGVAMGNLPLGPTGGIGERTPGGNPKYAGLTGLEFGRQELSSYLSTDTALRYVWPERKDLTGRLTAASPQAVSPLVQTALNWDPFFQRTVSSPSDEYLNLEPGDLADEYTSPIEKALASGLNQIFGTSLTAQQAKHIYQRYTGSVGSMLLNMANRSGERSGLWQGRPEAAKTSADTFITKAFYSRQPIGSNSDSVRELYKTWEEDQRVFNSFEWAKKHGKAQRYLDLIHDHPEIFPAAILQETIQDISQLYEERDFVKTTGDLEPDERADLLFTIDQAITMAAYEAMKVYWALKRDPDLYFDLMEVGND